MEKLFDFFEKFIDELERFLRVFKKYGKLYMLIVVGVGLRVVNLVRYVVVVYCLFFNVGSNIVRGWFLLM